MDEFVLANTLTPSTAVEARAEAWRRFIRVVHAGGAVEASGHAHDLDLLDKCRACGEHIVDAEHA